MTDAAAADMPTRVAAAVRAHDFAEGPLAFPLKPTASLQVHAVACAIGAPMLLALLFADDGATHLFHYAPEDLGAGALKLMPGFFAQTAVMREVLRALAEELIAKAGKNKYSTTIYAPNPWGAFDQWETATQLDDASGYLSESAASHYGARAERRDADTADSRGVKRAARGASAGSQVRAA